MGTPLCLLISMVGVVAVIVVIVIFILVFSTRANDILISQTIAVEVRLSMKALLVVALFIEDGTTVLRTAMETCPRFPANIAE